MQLRCFCLIVLIACLSWKVLSSAESHEQTLTGKIGELCSVRSSTGRLVGCRIFDIAAHIYSQQVRTRYKYLKGGGYNVPHVTQVALMGTRVWTWAPVVHTTPGAAGLATAS